MDRKRVLEILLAVVCVLFIPGYLVNLYFSHRSAAAAPEAPAIDPRFAAAFDAGVALERRQQYQEAIAKFLEAEMYAGKMPNGKYAALETAIEHYRSCNAALGQQDAVQAASKQLIRTLFEDGESLRNANQLEASVPKFQQVEEAAEGISDIFRRLRMTSFQRPSFLSSSTRWRLICRKSPERVSRLKRFETCGSMHS